MSASRLTDAERWLSTAAKLLDARDFVGAKDFAERAMDFDPLLPGVDQILAAAAVLDAAKHRANNWYAVLALDPSASPADVKREYRRLALLLHPDSNKSAAAADAFRLVVEAHTVLSDPARKSLFDAELQIGRSNPPPPAAGGGDPPFWTACPFCFHVYEFARVYHNRALRCPTCQRAFRAVETASPPAIVPGTDMYYCSWGFFPLGFSGGPGNPADPAWKPFYPTSPYWGNQPGQPAAVPVQQPQPLIPTQGGPPQPQPQPQPAVPAAPAAAAPARKKVVARKRVGGGLQMQSQPGPKSAWPSPEAWEDTKRPDEVMVVNPSGEVGILEGGKVNASVIHHIDATDELLGNLQSLPFPKDEAAEHVSKET